MQQRYTNGLSLLKQHYRLFDRIQLYDNTGTEARQVADFLPGGPLLQLAQPPAWAIPVLQHIGRMEALYQKAPRHPERPPPPARLCAAAVAGRAALRYEEK